MMFVARHLHPRKQQGQEAMTQSRYHLEVKEDNESGEYFIELPQELLDSAGFNIGDTLKWTDNKDGSWSLTKGEDIMDYYVVDVISTFRSRFVVKAKSGEHATDEVIFREEDCTFAEFSQKHLGTLISDTRKVTAEEVIQLHKVDNDYLASWPDDVVFEKLTHTINYED